jgi:hypothetical protein
MIPNRTKPSSFFLHLTLATAITPGFVILGIADHPWRYGLLNLLSFLVVVAVARCSIKIKLLKPVTTSKQLLSLFATASAVTALLVYASGGYRFINLDLTRVYELRSAAAEALPSAFKYILPIATKILIPSGIAIALATHRYRFVVAFVFIGLAIALAFNHKAAFVYPVIVIGVWFVATKRMPSIWMLACLLAVIAIGMIDALAIGAANQYYVSWVASIGIRRAFMVPALLNLYYWEYFTANPTILWADSRLTMGLLSSPYEVNAPQLIAHEYFAANTMSANTGWIGSGMAQAGHLGVLVYSMGLGCVLVLADNCSKRLGFPLTVSLFFISVITAATSTDFLTLFVTHGFAVVILIAVMLKMNQFRRSSEPGCGIGR